MVRLYQSQFDIFSENKKPLLFIKGEADQAKNVVDLRMKWEKINK